MADFEKAVQIVLKHEGLFVNHPSDPGGATNRGITFALFKQYAKALGLLPNIDALKSLTEDQAKFIYREQFWNRMKGSMIENQQVANILFDGFVNIGNRAIKMIQKVSGAEVDGDLGPGTLYLINKASPHILFDQFKEARITYYKNLAMNKPQMKVFLNGWLNRINSFKYEV